MPRPAFGPGSNGYMVKKTPSPLDGDDSDDPENKGTSGRAGDQGGGEGHAGERQEDEDGTRGMAVWGKDQGSGGGRSDYF
jgi:hypothetical protein